MARLNQIVVRNDVPLSLTLPAELIEGMAESANASDLLTLSDLSTALAERPILSTTYMRLPPSTAVVEGLESEFTRQWRLAEDVVGAIVPEAKLQRSVYPEANILDVRGAALLPDLGVRSVLLYPQVSASLERTTPNGVVARVALPNGSNLGVYTALDKTDVLFDDNVTDPTRRGIRLAAELLMERADLLRAGYSPDDIHLVIAPPTGLVPRPLVTSSFLDAVRGTSALQLVDLSSVQSVDANAPTLSLAPRSVVSVTGIGAAMYSLNVERTTVGSMLPASDVRLTSWDRQLAIVASRGSLVPGGADENIDGLKQQFNAISSISVAARARLGHTHRSPRHHSHHLAKLSRCSFDGAPHCGERQIDTSASITNRRTPTIVEHRRHHSGRSPLERYFPGHHSSHQPPQAAHESCHR